MRQGYAFAVVSLLCGAGAAGVAVLWGLIARDSGMMAPPPVDIADVQTLMALCALAMVFELGVPALGGAALIFAIPGWREPMAKAGLLLAVFAFTGYGAALAAVAQALAA